MTDAKTNILREEAKFFKNNSLTYDLLEVFIGEREGTEEEKRKLSRIMNRHKDGIYINAVYLLIHKVIKNKVEAKKIFNDILKHRNGMVKLLGRNVSTAVAALDYMQNIRNILQKPVILESDRYQEFAHKALIDETTETDERDLLDSDLEAEIEKARRFNSAFSILFIDIDNLKEINDTRGHESGTEAIQYVSNCIRKNLRKYDTSYRYGGDEFVTLLPRTDIGQARSIAGRIQELLAKEVPGSMAKSPTVSIGIAMFGREKNNTKKTLLSAADAALYKAKKAGKNRIGIDGGKPVGEIPVGKEKQSPAHLVIQSSRTCIQGIPLVPGLGIGTVLHYRDIMTRELELSDLSGNKIESEYRRIERAIVKVQKDLKTIERAVEKEIGSSHANIFNVHHMLLEDVDLMAKIEHELKDKMINAEHVVRNVFKQLEKKFRDSDSTVLQDRAQDIYDIGRRLLRVLTGAEESILATISPNTVIFTRRLLPSDTIHFTKRKPLAIVTEEGGPDAHSALIAKAMGIPSVSRVAIQPEEFPDGTEVIVNGSTGRVILNPDEQEKGSFKARRTSHIVSTRNVRKRTKNRNLTIHSKPVRVDANISSTEDIAAAIQNGCDGIGLYRIEPLFMVSQKMPGEKNIYTMLDNSLKPVKDREVTLRLPDFGGDKKLPYLNVGREHNSQLGIRGVRFLLHYPDFLRKQLRICLRLSGKYRIKILVPMVTIPEDMHEVKRFLTEEKQVLKGEQISFDENIPLGAMLETPASVMALDSILSTSDFISIGSNDLVQYITAADRESLDVSQYYQKGNELVLDSIRTIVEKAVSQGKECCLCGELAGNVNYTDRLLDCGLTRFSILPPLIPAVKNKIFEIAGSQ